MIEKPKVLYIDDERPNLTAFKHLFKNDYQVFTAETAKEGLKIFLANDIPVVISDQRMPTETGTELLEKIYKHSPHTVRIILTGYSDISAVIDGVNKSKLYYYLKKPLDQHECQMVIAHALESVELKKRLAISEEQYRNSFTCSPIGICHFDKTSLILSANPALCHSLSYNSADLCQNASLTDLVHKDDKEFLKTLIMNARADKSVAPAELRFLKKSGETSWAAFSISGKVELTTGVIFYVAAIQDITDLKVAEEEKKQLQDALRQAEKMGALGKMAGGIAHDFNNQLTGITALATFINERSKNSEVRKCADKLLTCADHSAALTRQLLSFGRKRSPERKVCDIHELAEDVTSMVKRTFGQSIRINLNLNAHEMQVNGDVGLIQAAILNLVLNARDALPDGGCITLESSNIDADEIDVDQCFYTDQLITGQLIKLDVKDNGTGMDEGTLKRIFEPFFTTKDIGSGTGMGLATVYGMVRQHQGALQVISQCGEGSAFSIILPTLREDVKEPAAPARPEKKLPKDLNILLAEDDDLLGELLLEGLDIIGCNAHLTEDGGRAIDYFKTHANELDLVILDYQMPRMNGGLCLQEMRKIKPDINAILVSGFSDSKILCELLAEPKTFFIQKPFRIASLVSMITEII